MVKVGEEEERQSCNRRDESVVAWLCVSDELYELWLNYLNTELQLCKNIVSITALN